MAKHRKCLDCGELCNGERCRKHHFEHLKATRNDRTCTEPGCESKLDRGTKGDKCYRHRTYDHKQQLGYVKRVLEEEAAVAPSLPGKPKLHGSFVVISDPHIPFHEPHTMVKACEAGQLLGIDEVIVAGDLIHADIISKYVNAGKQVRITDELVACSRALGALESVFRRIYVIIGNHDQRVEKMVAAWRRTSEGAKAFEIVARLLDVDEDAESVAYGILERFFSNPKVTLYSLPELIVNDTWLVMHPGTCSRVSPQTERKMANKFRKSVIGGHNHLFGIGFDDSGKDVAANIGHCSAGSRKFRYVREKVTTFPQSDFAQGFAVILQDDKHPGGRILPIAVHDRWFDLADLKSRLERNSEQV